MFEILNYMFEILNYNRGGGLGWIKEVGRGVERRFGGGLEEGSCMFLSFSFCPGIVHP